MEKKSLEPRLEKQGQPELSGKIKYQFTAEIWRSAGKGGWHFVSLPQILAIEIRTHLKSEEAGWGRLTVIAKIGDTDWHTAIWFDRKLNTYLLPLKQEIRKKESLVAGNRIDGIIWV